MKIIIPVDEASVESGVCVSFGRAPYFMLCEGGKAEFLPNPGAEAEGGAGLKAAQAVADSGAEALITVRCGENAAQVLKAADIRIYKSKDGTALANAAALEAGELGELTHFHAGFQGIQ